VLDINEFLERFVSHFLACKSSRFIIRTSASFESWFRAEIPVVLENWYSMVDIDTNFKYPNNSTKADLVIKAKDCVIVFELKSFVQHQDSNKKGSYPTQIRSLEEIVNTNYCKQGITFTTFMGYSQNQIESMVGKFFTSDKWKFTGLRWIPDSQFAFHVGSYIV